jgi:hypothetical protein
MRLNVYLHWPVFLLSHDHLLLLCFLS